ncbi:hypothetical protein N3K66_008878 [Trichothecium roseum]|uniref:Uncharacterized protein n=1 Tax=Trichothecium roseum TaxID=47278 RepID=A0ACC0URK2_9HYPO|nr:hypothetical protein N3K66_008878 [Trichothecium roseum]
MQFKVSSVFAALLATQQAAAAAVTPGQIITSLEAVDALAKDTTGDFDKLSPTNFFTNGPRGVRGLRDTFIRVQDITDALQLDPPKQEFSEADQQSICKALNEDAKIQETLLTSISNAHGTLEYTPFTQPTAAILRSLEGADDNLHFSLVDLVPTCGETVKTSYSKLNLKFDEVLSKYA